MKINIETEFNIGDMVYHKVPGSPQGMITGISYTASTNSVVYYVTYDPTLNEMTCFEWELTKTAAVV